MMGCTFAQARLAKVKQPMIENKFGGKEHEGLYITDGFSSPKRLR